MQPQQQVMPATQGAAQASALPRRRVLFDIVHADEPRWGGLEENICTLGKHLAALGYEPLIALRAPYAPQFQERLTAAGVRILDCPELLSVENRRPPIQTWVPAFCSLLRRERIDIYHMQSAHLGNEFWAAMAARVAGTRALLCTYHTQFFSESAQRRLAMSAVHGPVGVRAIAISHELYDVLNRLYRPPRSHLALIPPGIEDAGYQPSQGLSGGGGVLTLGYVGRLSHEKGLDLCITALAQLAEPEKVRLVVIGDGPEREALELQAQTLGMAGRVDFRGWVADASRYLSEFDVVVVSSRYEGFGLIAAEACAVGRPVIATRVGGLVDIVRAGETGWLVPAEDPAALAGAIEQAATDPAGLRRMGASARQRYEANWRAEDMANRVARAYEAALGKRGVPQPSPV